MTPRKKKPVRKSINRRKKNLNTPRSPQRILAQTRKNTDPPKGSRRKAWKYSKFVVLPASQEPYEKNCLEKEPIPPGYTFVPKGDVYITRHCRSKTKESQRVVYVVYNNAGKRTLGLRIPSEIYPEVLQSASETASSRANAVHNRDAKDTTRSRQLLHTQFPLMPTASLETVLEHAFLKGSGRVGRTAMKSDERKADLAVEAHIRHMHTPYEELLDAGMDRREAREAVWGTVRAIKNAWEGGGEDHPVEVLAVRSRDASDVSN